MIYTFKKVFFTITFNLSLFLILMIGIQNSNNRSSVNFLSEKTVKLPLSFIVGISFICGSISGSMLTTNYSKDRN